MNLRTLDDMKKCIKDIKMQKMDKEIKIRKQLILMLEDKKVEQLSKILILNQLWIKRKKIQSKLKTIKNT